MKDFVALGRVCYQKCCLFQILYDIMSNTQFNLYIFYNKITVYTPFALCFKFIMFLYLYQVVNNLRSKEMPRMHKKTTKDFRGFLYLGSFMLHTRRCSPLQGLSSSYCRGLWPLAVGGREGGREAMRGPQKKYCDWTSHRHCHKYLDY